LDTLILNDTPFRYAFRAPTNAVAIPSLLKTNDTRWIFTRFNDYWDGDSLGVTLDSSTFALSISGTEPNFFGLPYVSVKIAEGNTTGSSVVVTPSSPLPNWDLGGYFYPEPAQPQLQTAGYYFTRVPADFQDRLYYPAGAWDEAQTPVPGQSTFSPSTNSPLLIASVGDPAFRIVGFAKQSLLNGYSGLYGFLGQYFENAYK